MSSTVTAALVKELRDRTGVGMVKCKEALDNTKGNMEEAIDFLRKQGMASAVKKEGRDVKEGVALYHIGSDVISLCEINVETDFVAKNAKLLEFAKNIVEEIAATKPSSLERFMQQPYSKDKSITIDQYRALAIQILGENVQIRRISLLEKSTTLSFGIYSHMNGKILSIVTLSAPGLDSVAKDVAMHVTAASPEYLAPESIPKEVIAREREIARDQVKGKPANIVDKIIDGKMNAYYEQVCLTRQKFVKDDSISVQEFVGNAGRQQGRDDVRVEGFTRWAVGQK